MEAALLDEPPLRPPKVKGAKRAIDGMTRLYDIWQSGAKPDCSDLRCLG